MLAAVALYIKFFKVLCMKPLLLEVIVIYIFAFFFITYDRSLTEKN